MMEWGDSGLKDGNDVLRALEGGDEHAAFEMHRIMAPGHGERFTGLMADALDILRARLGGAESDELTQAKHNLSLLAKGLQRILGALGDFTDGGAEALARNPAQAVEAATRLSGELAALRAGVSADKPPTTLAALVEHALKEAQVPFNVERKTDSSGPACIFHLGGASLVFVGDGTRFGGFALPPAKGSGGGVMSVGADPAQKVVRLQIDDTVHGLQPENAQNLARALLNHTLRLLELQPGPIGPATMLALNAYVQETIAMVEALGEDTEIAMAMIARGVSLQREMLNRGVPLSEVARLEIVLRRNAVPPVAAPGVGRA